MVLGTRKKTDRSGRLLAALCAALLGAGVRPALCAEPGDNVLRPRFEVGAKTVEAVKGGKVLWKVQTNFAIGGVIIDRNYWNIFSKDEKTLQMVHAASGKAIYRTKFRVQNKAQAEKLVTQYLASLKPVKVTPEIKVRVKELIKALGSRKYTERESASKALVKIGKPALEALKEAKKSKDPEVVQRAQAAIEQIEGGEAVGSLQRLGWSAKLAVYKRRVAAEKDVAKCAARLSAAEKAKKKDEAKKSRAELAVAKKRLAEIEGLKKKMMQRTVRAMPVFPGGVMFKR